MIFISIARNYAENRKLRRRLLIAQSASRPRNRILGWVLGVSSAIGTHTQSSQNV